jgi:hypothetical protein
MFLAASTTLSRSASAFGAPRGLTSRRRLRQRGTPTQVSCARIGRPSGPMLALAERRFDPGRRAARRRPRPRVGEVTVGADQPHPGSMCAITRLQRLFRGWHVMDGDVDRVLREDALDDVASGRVLVLRTAARDAGRRRRRRRRLALMGVREATEGRAFAGSRPTATDSVSSCGSPSANG